MAKPLFEEKQLLPVLKFLVKFNVFVIPLYIILVTDWSFTWLQTLTANISYYMLAAAKFSPALDNLLITIPIKNGNWAAYISWDCTGWKSILAFFALVMSTDFPLSRKLSGLMLIPVIYLINIARILFMFYYVRTFDLQYYQAVHSLIWGWGLILTVLVLWVVWVMHRDMNFLARWERQNQKKAYIPRKRK